MSKPRRKFDTRAEPDEEKVRDIGKRRKFHPHDLISLSPQTPRQEDFLRAFYDDVPLIVQSGAAGSGKTTIALYAALGEVFEPSSPYDKVVVVRSAVSSRNIGFLPGDVNDKQAPYEEPYRAIAADIMKFHDPYDNLKALGQLEFRLSSYLRGLNLEDCIVIVDEVQNFTRTELLTVMTRLTGHSRLILCGDSKQDDVSDRNNKSAFGYLMKLLEMIPQHQTFHVQYRPSDCLRTGIVRDILIADGLIPE